MVDRGEEIRFVVRGRGGEDSSANGVWHERRGGGYQESILGCAIIRAQHINFVGRSKKGRNVIIL